MTLPSLANGHSNDRAVPDITNFSATRRNESSLKEMQTKRHYLECAHEYVTPLIVSHPPHLVHSSLSTGRAES